MISKKIKLLVLINYIALTPSISKWNQKCKIEWPTKKFCHSNFLDLFDHNLFLDPF